MTYIYTFHSHFFATRFSMEKAQAGVKSTLMPVPRKISSSCGTCVKIEGDFDPLSLVDDGVDHVFEVSAGVNKLIYESE